MDWIDQKYIGLISNKVSLFKRQQNNVYNMRCPLCGDSKTNKHKARGYIVEKPIVGVIYYCHNCHASISLMNFLSQVDVELGEQYKRERFLERGNVVERPPQPDISKVVVQKYMKKGEPLKSLKRISQLPVDHPARKYVNRRKIPSNAHYRLFYAPRFKTWVNSIIPEKFAEESLSKDEPRLILPFIDQGGNLFGFQGRSFDPLNKIRYISIMLDTDKPKVFGLDTVDARGVVYCCEGPIDSLFVPNCIAMAGSDINLDAIFPDKPRNEIVIVMDNEPRNKEIVFRVEKAIERGYNVCIWPSDLEEKDVNDMVVSGKDPEQLIKENTYVGLAAYAAFTSWKRI